MTDVHTKQLKLSTETVTGGKKPDRRRPRPIVVQGLQAKAAGKEPSSGTAREQFWDE